MIVDDKIATIGSANINDRSFLGDRDSELNVVIEGGIQNILTFDGQPTKVSAKLHELRMKLFR